MSKVYRYVELSPRGFSNELDYIASCDSREEMEELKSVYYEVKDVNGCISRVWAVKRSDIENLDRVVPAKKLIELYKAYIAGEQEKAWELHDEIDFERDRNYR
jgi:hypothetical protein